MDSGIHLVWCLGVAMLDNVLKPILIGLFVGPIVPALGYQLFLAWMHGRHRQISTASVQAGGSSAALRMSDQPVASWPSGDPSPASNMPVCSGTGR